MGGGKDLPPCPDAFLVVPIGDFGEENGSKKPEQTVQTAYTDLSSSISEKQVSSEFQLNSLQQGPSFESPMSPIASDQSPSATMSGILVQEQTVSQTTSVDVGLTMVHDDNERKDLPPTSPQEATLFQAVRHDDESYGATKGMVGIHDLCARFIVSLFASGVVTSILFARGSCYFRLNCKPAF